MKYAIARANATLTLPRKFEEEPNCLLLPFNSSVWGPPVATAFQASGFSGHLSVCFTEEMERQVNASGRLSEGLPLPVPTPATGSLPRASFGVPVMVPCQQGKKAGFHLYPAPPEASILERFPFRIATKSVRFGMFGNGPARAVIPNPARGRSMFFPTSQRKVGAVS